MARAANVARGGGKRYGAEVVGLKELETKLKNIQSALVSKEAEAAVAKQAINLENRVRANAQSANVPHEVHDDIFSYSKQPASAKRRGISALTGVRKRGQVGRRAQAYVEWRPNRQRGAFEKFKRSAKRRSGTSTALTLPGLMNDRGTSQLIGENLATMWELGTTKFAARPFFRPAVEQKRADILSGLTEDYKGIIERHAK
jgi:hypothetical protein